MATLCFPPQYVLLYLFKYVEWLAAFLDYTAADVCQPSSLLMDYLSIVPFTLSVDLLFFFLLHLCFSLLSALYGCFWFCCCHLFWFDLIIT